MSEYGVSVLITILVTSLVAFYLLYKSKELSLGVVISVTIGSIVLGFTFSPIFKVILNLFITNFNINKTLVIVMSLLTILFVFLIIILIISIITTIAIPKKYASIDCSIAIDRVIAKIKIKDGLINFKNKLTKFFKKIIFNIKELAKNTYNLKNKLKKPVDTKQIIDTMGIEKNDNSNLEDKNKNTLDSPFASLLGFMEPNKDVEVAYKDSSKADNENEDLEDNTYESLVAKAYQEIVSSEVSDEEKEQNELVDSKVDTENALEDTVVENIQTEDDEIKHTEELVAAIEEIERNEELVAAIEEIERNEELVTAIEEIDQDEELVTAVEEIEHDGNLANAIEEIEHNEELVTAIEEIDQDEELVTAIEEIEHDEDIVDLIEDIEYDEDVAKDEQIIDANSLVLKAFECKDSGKKEEAIEHYLSALQYEQSNEMVFWIVLDVCALYKQLGLSDLAKIILEGLVSKYGSIIQPDIKKEIMNNLK